MELPASTFSRTPTIASRSISSSVCSSRVCRERNIGMPDAISVANWREKIASARRFTLLKRWKMRSSWSASRFSLMSRTISPRSRSCSETMDLEVASISPRAGTPARSTALKANVLIGSASRPLRRRRHHAHARTEQPLELLGYRGALLGEGSIDPAAANQLCEVRVHRLHSHRSGGLQGRIDLVRLSLADEVPDRRSRHHDLAGNDARGAIGRGQQLLGDDPLKGNRQLHP